MKCGSQQKIENKSVMTQMETKWNAHLEVMETQGYLCDINMCETHMCDLHTKIMETQDICATFTKRKVGHST